MSTEALHKLIDGAATVKNQVVGRLYYDELPSGEFGPAIVLQRGNNGRELIHKKTSGLVKGFAYANCFAPTHLGASDLAGLVIAAIDGFSGVVALEGGDVQYNFIMVEDETEIAINPPEARDQSPVHGVRLDVRYAFQETAPNLIGA